MKGAFTGGGLDMAHHCFKGCDGCAETRRKATLEEMIKESDPYCPLCLAHSYESDEGSLGFSEEIKKRVNMFEELVKALRWAELEISQSCDLPDPDGMIVAPDSILRVKLAKLQELIARATGEETK